MPTTFRPLLVVVLPLALVVAACSGAGASSAPSADAPTIAPSVEPSVAPSEAPVSEAPSEAPASEAPAGDAVTELALAESDHGMILTDGAGMTLYGFTPDTDGTPTCYDDCAAAWPPVVGGDTTGITVADGLDGAKLSTVERTDGIRQLVYGDWPLYYFAGDSAPGDTNGQALNEVWFVIGADGALIGQS